MTPIKKSDQETPKWARCLVLGASKIGKSTAVVNSMPRPLVINCDGNDALSFASTMPSTDEWASLNVTTKKDLRAAIKVAEQGVKDGEYATIVVDTISVLAANLQYELGLTYSGFELWDELKKELLRMYIQLDRLPAHLVLVCHLRPPIYNEKKEEIKVDVGDLPDIGGSVSRELPKRVSNVILFKQEIEQGAPKTYFLAGAQTSWNVNSRGLKGAVKIPSEEGLPAILRKMGIRI